MGNKQEELEVCTQLQSYDLIGIMETWWDSSPDWSAPVEGYMLFRKDRVGRRGGGVELYTKERLECMELYLRTGDKAIESLRVRIRRQTGTGDAVLDVCYRPDQEEEVDEAFFRQLEKASQSQALALMRDFNHPSIYWKDNTAGCKQSRRLLESMEDYFLMRVINEPTRENALLDLLLTNKEEPVDGVKAEGSPWLQRPRDCVV